MYLYIIIYIYIYMFIIILYIIIFISIYYYIYIYYYNIYIVMCPKNGTIFMLRVTEMGLFIFFVLVYIYMDNGVFG